MDLVGFEGHFLAGNFWELCLVAANGDLGVCRTEARFAAILRMTKSM
jgi:hypothetical protein